MIFSLNSAIMNFNSNCQSNRIISNKEIEGIKELVENKRKSHVGASPIDLYRKWSEIVDDKVLKIK